MALDEQKKLKKFIARRHPVYDEMLEHWEFLEETYEGGRCWFEENIHKYVKEGSEEYDARRKRAYRFNHTREVVDIVGKYLFKMEIKRDLERAPATIKDFWKTSTLSGLPIEVYAKRIANRASVFGRIWIVVDSTKTEDVLTRADEKQVDARIYSYILRPQDMLDISYDRKGNIQWALVYEAKRDDADPMESSGEIIDQYRLWTTTDSTVFRVERKGNSTKIVPEAPIKHDLGVVPIFAADDVASDEPYTSPAMIADVAYLDRAVANYLSNLDAIVQDQTFSQLTMPAQGVLPGEDTYDKLLEMGTKRMFTYDGESGAKPEYISPDVKQADLVLRVINKIINEIYHSVGLAGERTKEDNALGIDNSSGVAKAYDFERVNSLLAAKADSLEQIENRLCWFVAKWSGEEQTIENLDQPLVFYPDDFDVRGLYDEFEIASKLSLIEAPASVRQEQLKAVIDKLFPQLKDDIKQKMLDELKTWPPQPVLDPTQSGSKILANVGKSSEANKLVKS